MGDEPTHRELLDDLSANFIKNGWSLKWLHREILNSATWQQTSVNPTSEEKDPENQYYSRMTRRRLDIESWRDSLLFVAGELDQTTGGAGTNLDDIKNIRRTIYGKIHRRDMNKMLQVHDFPDPAAHSPAREETISPLQMLFALNSPFVQTRADRLAKRYGSVIPIYETLFQRVPSETEQSLAREFLEGGTLPDFAAALMASNEFLYID